MPHAPIDHLIDGNPTRLAFGSHRQIDDRQWGEGSSELGDGSALASTAAMMSCRQRMAPARVRTLVILAMSSAAFPTTVRSSDVPRNALWLMVRTCVVAMRTVGVPFPCRTVKPDERDASGVAVIRDAASATHFLVVPTSRIQGIESPELQRPEAGSFWGAALAARRFVVDATESRIHLDDVGLAINAKGGRTQDQLHIHLDCTRPDVQSILRRHDSAFGPTWRRLPFRIDGILFWGLRVGAQELTNANLFSRLANLPDSHRNLHAVTVGVFAGRPNSRPGSFYVLAHRARKGEAERLLDHSCALARI